MKLHDCISYARSHLVEPGVGAVASRILRVSGLSGHEPGSKNLQNKQGTDGSVSFGSPMLKLVKEMRASKMSVL